MKKILLLITTLSLTITLSGCGLFRDNLEQHENTLSKYDNYVMTLNTTFEVSGITTENKVYYYVDNTNDATCITSYNPLNLREIDDVGESSFGCLGIQVSIQGDDYYYDGDKAYLFANPDQADVTKIFFNYFDVKEFEEEGKDKIYSANLTVEDLEYSMKKVIGITSETDEILKDSLVTVSATYSEEQDRFTEFRVEYLDYINNLYDYLGSTSNATKAYTTFTFDYFDKKYVIDTLVPDDSIDDYPDSLGMAELVGYTVIEDAGSKFGNFLNIDDTDIFEFDASGANEYTLKIDVPNGQIIQYTVTDFNGGLVKSGYFDLVFGYETSLELVSSGIYYVLINPLDESDYPIEYTFTIE